MRKAHIMFKDYETYKKEAFAYLDVLKERRQGYDRETYEDGLQTRSILDGHVFENMIIEKWVKKWMVLRGYVEGAHAVKNREAYVDNKTKFENKLRLDEVLEEEGMKRGLLNTIRD